MLLKRFMIERLLYRLSQSSYQERFVLKGAMLFMLWTGTMHRPTQDLDLLAYGDDSPQKLVAIFREICQLTVDPDGLTFDPTSITAEPIREEQKYLGWRLRITSNLGTARIPMQIDIGFGDAVTPPPAATFVFDGPTLAQAIQATFQRCGTAIPAVAPTALTEAFAQNDGKQKQWKAFLHRNHLSASTDFAQVCYGLREFLLPLLASITTQTRFDQRWMPGGPWCLIQIE